MAVVGDVDFCEDKMSTAGGLTASEFVFTSERHGRLVFEASFFSFDVIYLPRDRWALLAI